MASLRLLKLWLVRSSRRLCAGCRGLLRRHGSVPGAVDDGVELEELDRVTGDHAIDLILGGPPSKLGLIAISCEFGQSVSSAENRSPT